MQYKNAYESTKEVRDRIQKYIDEFYDHFLLRVSEGRGKTIPQIHEIAQGRVWTGKSALEIGLVDELGDLDDAIAIAAEKAGIADYRLKEYPEVKEPIQQFIDNLTGNDNKEPMANNSVNTLLQSELGDMYPHVKALREMMQTKGVQARIPYLIDFE